MSDLLPLSVLASALGVDGHTVRTWAREGRISVVLAPGCKRKRLASRAEIEKRFGRIDDATLDVAWKKYRHCHVGMGDAL
jgi:predicted site-specific integrase-resolvase